MSGLSPNSLAYAVYMEIYKTSPDCAERFKEVYGKTIFHNTSESELVLLNRFWRRQLSRLTIPTYHERECLLDLPDFGPWMLNFTRHVIPCIVANGLPHPEV